MEEKEGNMFKHIFKPIDKAVEFPSYLKQIFGTCLELYTEHREENKHNDHQLEKEFIYHLYITIKRCNDSSGKCSKVR